MTAAPTAPTTPAAPGERPADRSPAFPLKVFALVGSAVSVVVALAPWVWPRGEAPPRPHMAVDGLLGNWLWWDGGWYVHIAKHGYSYHPHHQSSVAFFPVYPLTVRAIGWLTPGGPALAAILITAVCGAITLTLFHHWCTQRLPANAARTAVVLLAVYPYAWFLYGAAYSDALFLSLALGAFLLLEADHPIAAGLLGALATAARPTGVAVLAGLVAMAVRDRHLARRRAPAVLLAAGGVMTWCAWLAVRFGNPFAFIETEGSPGWNQPPGPHTWLKVEFFHNITHVPPTGWLRLIPQALLCVAFLATVPAINRRFGRDYAAFVLATAAIPTLFTSDFMGSGRYLLLAFPVFALLGSLITEHAIARAPIITMSAGLLLFGTSLFGAGYLLT